MANARRSRLASVAPLAGRWIPCPAHGAGEGVAAVEVLRARFAADVDGADAAQHATWRPTLADGRRPARPSRLLLEPDELSPGELGELGLAPRFQAVGGTLRAQVPLPAGTSLYGTGEVAGPLLRNGRGTVLWNTDAHLYGEHSPSLYQSHPWVLALLPGGEALGLLADSHERGAVLCADDGVELQLEGEPFDLHAVRAARPEDVLRGLARRIGRIEPPPAWALGYHQCRYSYASAAEVLAVADELRARRHPCDAVWLDIDYMDRHRAFTWHPERFPDPTGLVEALHARGLRCVAILDPGVAARDDFDLYREGLEGRHFVLDERGRPALGLVWPGACAFPDFTRAATRRWWADHVERFVRTSGLDGLWVDMNEPAVQHTPLRTLPDSARHRGLGGGSHARFHNLYGTLMARATREGLVRARRRARPFVLTRANHLAGSREAATWTGDNQATWDDLRWTVSMVLNLGLSGQPFSGPDLGGFDGDPDPELFARWFELAAFVPFARGHGEKTTCRKEPWSFGPRVEAVVRRALELRVRLRPTLVSLFQEAARHGLPPWRPLCFADPADARLRSVDDAFLLGADLLVAPVLEPGRERRRVLLPDGAWQPWTPDAEPGEGPREQVARGAVEVAAPLGRTPVFARVGSIAFLGPPGLSFDPAPAGRLELHVFPDADGRARGRLHEIEPERRRPRARTTEWSARLLADGGLDLGAEHGGDLPARAGGLRALVHLPGQATREIELSPDSARRGAG